MKRRHFLHLSAATLAAPRARGSGTAAAPDFSWLDARLRERVLHEAYFGDGGPDVVRHVASTGKWTAAAAIAALVDEGRLRWDDPVRAFLPRFTGATGDATLRQLLSHTAGYPDYQPERRRRDDYPTLAESVAHIVDLPAWQPLHVEPRLLLGRSARRRLAAAAPALPVLIVRGDLERIDFAIRTLPPRAEVAIVPDCGHVSNLEQPRAFTAALTRFLARV